MDNPIYKISPPRGKVIKITKVLICFYSYLKEFLLHPLLSSFHKSLHRCLGQLKKKLLFNILYHDLRFWILNLTFGTIMFFNTPNNNFVYRVLHFQRHISFSHPETFNLQHNRIENEIQASQWNTAFLFVMGNILYLYL